MGPSRPETRPDSNSGEVRRFLLILGAVFALYSCEGLIDPYFAGGDDSGTGIVDTTGTAVPPLPDTTATDTTVVPDPPVPPAPPVEQNSWFSSWFELPAMQDSDRDGICDSDSDLYYASHSFTQGSVRRRNYTVCYSSGKHCPVWVAAPRHAVYSSKGTSRSDAYAVDPDIPSKYQYNSKSTGGGCNKGHMLGSAERLCCAAANRQVFYYTNIAPQLSSGFNTGGGGWNLLEDFIDGVVCADTLYEVVGCYFERFTDGYGNTVSPKTIEFGGRSDVAFPTMFYYAVLRTKSGSSGKAVSKCSASELQCVAFVRAHTNSLKGQEPTSREMMSISDLEKLTGFKYFTNVPNAPKNTFSASDWL